MKLTKGNPGSYAGDIMPDKDIVFVFGSNPEGRHGAGAARTAKLTFGAIYGRGEGLQGNAYAIPTKDLRVTANNGYRSIPPERIIGSIVRMYETARSLPYRKFCVAYRNVERRSLNGYTGYEMMDMFRKAAERSGGYPKNVYFSSEWTSTEKLTIK